LAADLQDEAVNRLKRQLAGCIEMLTKQLERLDSLSLADSTDELKSRRKTSVRRIQVCTDFFIIVIIIVNSLSLLYKHLQDA